LTSPFITLTRSQPTFARAGILHVEGDCDNEGTDVKEKGFLAFTAHSRGARPCISQIFA
jgi:hypothetical protein